MTVKLKQIIFTHFDLTEFQKMVQKTLDTIGGKTIIKMYSTVASAEEFKQRMFYFFCVYEEEDDTITQQSTLSNSNVFNTDKALP